MKVIKHRCFPKLNKIALQKGKKSHLQIKHFQPLYYYVTVCSGDCCCITNHPKTEWPKTAAVVLWSLLVFVGWILERPRQGGSGAEQWLKLAHKGWSSPGWGWPLCLSVCLSVGSQGLFLWSLHMGQCGLPHKMAVSGQSVCLHGRKKVSKVVHSSGQGESSITFHSLLSEVTHVTPPPDKRRLHHLMGTQPVQRTCGIECNVLVCGPLRKNIIHHSVLYNNLKTKFQSQFLGKQTEKLSFHNL